jgi:hypothetical protein
MHWDQIAENWKQVKGEVAEKSSFMEPEAPDATFSP